MKIIDGFIFYNEIDILKYRLSILYDVVDYFIIVESTTTFIGNTKDLYFEKNKSDFSKYLNKIVHIVVDDMPNTKTDSTLNRDPWINEYFQRNCISRGVDKLSLIDEDIIMISDVDEIPDPSTVTKIKNSQIPITINYFEQDLYYYNLNCKIDRKWPLAKCLTYKRFNEIGKSCESIRRAKCGPIKQGGWHMSYFGDSMFISNKIKNFSHQEYNNSNTTDTSKIEERVLNFKDLYGRSDVAFIKISVSENTYLPPKHEEYLTKFYKD